jgi:radical SAM superfamily enzyme YgiQ (UPF0313 family)
MTKKSRVLFINPASVNKDALPIPPLGILYLAAYIRKAGYNDIKVIDNNFYNYPLERLECEIKNFDVIAVSGTTSQFAEAKEISRIAKKHNKISIMGGPHATPLPEETLESSDFDFVAIGEGEITLKKLLLTIESTQSYDKVKGIMFKKNGIIVKTSDREFIKNIDEIPFPDRELIPLLEYGDKELKRFEGQYTHMMTSRGCGGKCIFCSSPLMWRYCRLMSAERVFEEMMEIHKNYGITNIHFQDDNFTLQKKRVDTLCDLIIGSEIPFKWSCQARPDRVDEELLRKMKRAGCVQIEFGVESGDPEILVTANKKYTKEQIKKAFHLAKKVGIKTWGFFIVGLPGETIKSWIMSMRFAKQLRLDGSVWTVLVPFPGTEVFNKNLVKILDLNYTYWLYKQPVIKVNRFGPTSLKIMRRIADKYVNGLFYTGPYRKGIGKRLRE